MARVSSFACGLPRGYLVDLANELSMVCWVFVFDSEAPDPVEILANRSA